MFELLKALSAAKTAFTLNVHLPDNVIFSFVSLDHIDSLGIVVHSPVHDKKMFIPWTSVRLIEVDEDGA